MILNEDCDFDSCFLIRRAVVVFVFVFIVFVVVIIIRGGVMGGGGLQGRGATMLLEGGTWAWRWRRREMALRVGLVISF